MPPSSYLHLFALPPSSYTASHINIERRVAYAITLRNTSSIPAQLPFFCFMDLGVGLEAHRDWQLDKIVSEGRRLIRCSYHGTASLMPAEQAVACSLVLRISMQDGMQVSFGTGAPSSVDGMKDLRLFAITGAANFPAQRCQLLVAADAVRKGLSDATEALARQRAMAV